MEPGSHLSHLIARERHVGRGGGFDFKPEPPSPGGQWVKQHQGNWSKQKQIQFVPIAPQASFQNVNLFTHGKVSQGDANNANTGQANQQHNTQIAWLQQGLPHGNPDGYGENARR